LLATEFPFENIIGVEFAEELNVISRENLRRYRQKKSAGNNVQIITGDVVEYQFTGREEVIYISNPFDDIVMQQVLDNLVYSLAIVDRDLWLIYSTAIHRAVLDKCNVFNVFLEASWGGHDFVVYRHSRKS
jgi:hypothetical protein